MEPSQIFRHAAETLEALELPFLVVGSCAGIAHGEARFTQDNRIVAAFERKHVTGRMAAFPGPESDHSRSAVEDAIRSPS